MNLIEQLGGYEKAKEKMDDICHTLDNSELLGGGDAREGLYERLESIDKALLEYRRAHNIFENGDKVVHIHDCENSMLFTVKDISSKGYSFGNDWGWYGVISNMGVGYTFRHATSEEIKAGHRL